MKGCSVYIVLTRPNTIISKIIHVVKQDQYTHASISLDRQLNHMYSFGRKYTYNPFLGRFRREDINQGVYRLWPTLPGAIIELEVSREQYERVKEKLASFISNPDVYKYNYMGLIHNLLEKPVLNENRFLCSEFVYYILKESQILNLNISRNLVRPQMFLHIGGKIIYEGDLKVFRFLETRVRSTVGSVQLSTQYE